MGIERKYKFEVIGTTCSNEGIIEGTSDSFSKLSKAKLFVEKNYSNDFLRIKNYQSTNIILKYSVVDGNPLYVKRIWIFKDKKWYSTKKIKKYRILMEY